jgi:hypothetical protein
MARTISGTWSIYYSYMSTISERGPAQNTHRAAAGGQAADPPPLLHLPPGGQLVRGGGAAAAGLPSLRPQPVRGLPVRLPAQHGQPEEHLQSAESLGQLCQSAGGQRIHCCRPHGGLDNCFFSDSATLQPVLRIRIRDPVLFTPWIRDPDSG